MLLAQSVASVCAIVQSSKFPFAVFSLITPSYFFELEAGLSRTLM